MKRHLIIIIVALLACTSSVWAQRGGEDNYRERLRYRQMNRQGVWAVGLGIEPVVSLNHPVSYIYGNGRQTGVGSFGLNLETSYFVVDNLSVVASFGYVNNSWSSVMRFNYMDSATTLSSRKVRLGARWHIDSWALGGGVTWGRSALKYECADLEAGGVNSPIYGEESFYDPRTTIGYYYEGSYTVNPFVRVGVFYDLSFTTLGSRYAHALGARLTIYLPFMDAVVCR